MSEQLKKITEAFWEIALDMMGEASTDEEIEKVFDEIHVEYFYPCECGNVVYIPFSYPMEDGNGGYYCLHCG